MRIVSCPLFAVHLMCLCDGGARVMCAMRGDRVTQRADYGTDDVI